MGTQMPDVAWPPLVVEAELGCIDFPGISDACVNDGLASPAIGSLTGFCNQLAGLSLAKRHGDVANSVDVKTVRRCT